MSFYTSKKYTPKKVSDYITMLTNQKNTGKMFLHIHGSVYNLMIPRLH